MSTLEGIKSAILHARREMARVGIDTQNVGITIELSRDEYLNALRDPMFWGLGIAREPGGEFKLLDATIRYKA